MTDHTFPDEVVREYIERDGNFCPYCKSDNIQTLNRDIPITTVLCNDCEETWDEEYELVGLDEQCLLKPVDTDKAESISSDPKLIEALEAIKNQLSHLFHNGQVKANAPERERIQICIVNAEYAIEKATHA